MSQRRHVSLVSAGATLLAALPLSTVFDRWTWLVDSVIAVGVTLGVALAVRSFRAPVWAATAAMCGSLLLLLTWIFPSGKELAGIIPTLDSFRHFNDLLLSAGQDMRSLGIPVEDRDGLLFLVTLGIGSVGIAVDLFAVVLRRPALAGLPMLAIYSVPVAVHEDSVNPIPFVLGAAGFLWLLVTDNVDRVRRFGRRFTGDGRDVDLWEPSPLAAAGRRLAMVGVVLAVLLPLAVPGMTSGLIDRLGTSGGGDGTGRTGGRTGPSVNLFAMLSGQLNLSKQTDMVRVQTGDPSPYYLRFGVADDLTPAGFRNRPPSGGQTASSNLPRAQLEMSGVSQKTYRAAVEILDFDMTLLPIYLSPIKIDKLDNAWLYDRGAQVVYSNRATSKGKRYTFEYVRTEYSPAALRTAAPLPRDNPIQSQFTARPPNSKVTSKANELTAAKQTPYDKVRAILDYFSVKNGFTYSLSTKTGTSGSDMVDFLENQQGFCEQYSAAMAWMVRAADIPARVAFGFTRGSKHSGSSWTLTNYNLHAWTEVYFDKFGWVPFDPTPATNVPGSVHGAWAPDPNATNLGSGESGSGEDDLTPGPGVGSSTSPGAFGPHEKELTDPFGAGTIAPNPPTWPRWTLLVALLGLLVLATPATARGWLRRRRWPDRIARPAVAVAAAGAGPGEPRVLPSDEAVDEAARRRAHGAWDELIDTMMDYRIELDESETPRTTAERLIDTSYLRDSDAEGARLLGSAEERARYARRPLDSDELAASLTAVRGAIKGRVSRRTRLIATFLPPSVLQRWRTGSVLWATNAVNRTAALRDRVLRKITPRRLLPSRFGRV